MTFVVRSLIVTFLAAVVAWLPMAILLTIGIDANLALPLAGRLLLLPILGCAFVGLPLALIVFRYSPELTLRRLLLLANAAGVLVTFTMTVLGGGFAAFFYGMPSLLAANGFAVFGWLLIIRPTLSRADA